MRRLMRRWWLGAVVVGLGGVLLLGFLGFSPAAAGPPAGLPEEGSIAESAALRQAQGGEPLPAAGPCNVSGFIVTDTVWGPAYCDPYIATGSVIVSGGVTLTIQPGTTVKFTSLKALIVNGGLVARGTASSVITFTSNAVGPNKGDWGYIHFTDSSADAVFDDQGNYLRGSIIQYAVIEYGGGANLSENGALRIEASAPYIDRSPIRNSKTDGIHAWNAADGLRLTSNRVTDNGIPGTTNARGISVSGSGRYTIRGNTVSNNTGGGISASGTATISNNTVSGNTASYGGGGISAFGTATISNNTVSGNTASGYGGGGIYASGTATISNNTITGNTASGYGYGGGIYVDGTATIANNTVSGNTASGYGGGIYVDGTATISNGNRITNNTAATTNRGGGIYLCNRCRPVINGNNIYGNMSGNPATTPNDLYNGNAYGGADVNAESNWWGTADVNAIEDRIWHFIDDASLGIVDYVPFAPGPILPTPTPTATPTPTPTPTPTATPTPTPTPVPLQVRDVRASPNPFSPNTGTTISYTLSKAATAALIVLDGELDLVRTMGPVARPGGPGAFAWDGRNQAGQVISSGLYVPVVLASAGAESAYGYTLATADNGLAPVITGVVANPNPIVPPGGTTVSYQVSKGSVQVLLVLDALGAEVRRIIAGYKRGGPVSIFWDGDDNDGNYVPNGNYILVPVAVDLLSRVGWNYTMVRVGMLNAISLPEAQKIASAWVEAHRDELIGLVKAAVEARLEGLP